MTHISSKISQPFMLTFNMLLTTKFHHNRDSPTTQTQAHDTWNIDKGNSVIKAIRQDNIWIRQFQLTLVGLQNHTVNNSFYEV